MPDDLSEHILEGALRGRFGVPARVLDRTTSTNTIALEWSEAGAPEGALVVADHQTAGRGRWGRTWASEPGAGLLFSLVLRPRAPVAHLSLLTTAVGVAVCEGISASTSLPARLKWPNDVRVAGRKLGGILVETRVGGREVSAAVAGVGVNVRWDPARMPGEIAGRATSVSVEMERAGLGPAPARADLLAAVLEGLEGLYPALGDEVLRRATLRSDVLGRRVHVVLADGRELTGRAERLLASGALEVSTPTGPVTVHSGEIERLDPDAAGG
jgi:BirA family transcriptional regulator, biotin operon repressor / biotin---[acetyl-CoA-carboxylase] ligase